MDIKKILRNEIAKSKKSRYRIGVETGITQPILCKLVNKTQADIKVETAQILLDYFGYELKKKVGK